MAPEAVESVERAESAVVYGNDDRLEYYDAPSEPLRHLFESHSVALISKQNLTSLLDGPTERLPSWADLDRLCDGEPFAEQKAAVYCSGVLAADGLVLTAEHCLYGKSIEDIRVVFGYYFVSPDRLAIDAGQVFEIGSVVSTSSENGKTDGVDFAWLRPKRNGDSQRLKSPAPIHTQSHLIATGDSIVTVNAGGGVPLKLDAGGHVFDARDFVLDYFIADTDTSRGSSGGGAFASDGSLVGIFTRGSSDFELTESGCRTTRRRLVAEATEQFTYVQRAVDGLCRVEPLHTLCEPSCEQPCRDVMHASALAVGPSCGIAIGGSRRVGALGSRSTVGILLVASAVVLLSRKISRGAGRGRVDKLSPQFTNLAKLHEFLKAARTES